jgi:WD40 repeat protein
MSAVRDRLRDAPLPGEAEAAARSWPVVEAALAERAPSSPPRRLPTRLVLVAALLCVGLATVLSPAGAWIGDRFQDEGNGSRPAFAPLPKGGSVLAISRSGAYAVRADGSTRRLGSFSEAGWSPHGLHVVGVNGRGLTAVDPLGTVKWTLTARHPVHHPAWSTDLGFAVAYLEGTTLRVVAGDGDPATDRALRRRAAAVTPAWRPRSDRVLTYATRDGAIETIDVATGRRIWREAPRGTSSARASARLRSLAWSRDGHRLVALSSRSVTILDAGGHVVRTIALPSVGRELALHPSGRKVAVVISGAGGNRVLGVRLSGSQPTQLFQGNVDSLAWSRDGRWLLLGWRGAGQWLLLGPHGRIKALHGVTGELGAAGGFPRVAGWCCAG